MAVEDNVRENDQVFEDHGVRVIVDDASLRYLKGTVIDYQADGGRPGFQIKQTNPAADGGDGCGSCCSGC